MKIELLIAALSVPILGGIAFARIRFKRRQQGALASRLSRWTKQTVSDEAPATLLRKNNMSSSESWHNQLLDLPGVDFLVRLIILAGLESDQSNILAALVCLFVLPIVLALVLDFDITLAAIAGFVFALVPVAVLKVKAEARRTKFCQQLPDAIDLMIAVLRSGHSVAQAVKAVADEIANPCGQEFEGVLHRMNLGQPLSEALSYSARHFQSYELDLIRRAVSIQAEVGGSLAELLDKTNFTLRQRLKLVRQLSIITSQSRLSAWIVGLLPLVLACGLNFMNPGYLPLLFHDQIGQMLLGLVILLEITGVFVMRRMSTMRI